MPLDRALAGHTFWRRLKRPKVFHDTTHADRRRQERNLSLEQMQDVVVNHEQQIQHRRGEHGGFVYEFIRRVEKTKLTVIADLKHTECWLITGWVEQNEN